MFEIPLSRVSTCSLLKVLKGIFGELLSSDLRDFDAPLDESETEPSDDVCNESKLLSSESFAIDRPRLFLDLGFLRVFSGSSAIPSRDVTYIRSAWLTFLS